jgi:biopolymer transport protein ExbD
VKPDLFNIGVDKVGNTFLGREALPLPQIVNVLSNRFRMNTNLGVYVTGDRAARHADIIRVLYEVRSAGIQKVAFAVTPSGK